MSTWVWIPIVIVVVAGLFTVWRLLGPNVREVRPWRQTRHGEHDPEIGDPPPRRG
jgi:hypothetical protein